MLPQLDVHVCIQLESSVVEPPFQYNRPRIALAVPSLVTSFSLSGYLGQLIIFVSVFTLR